MNTIDLITKLKETPSRNDKNTLLEKAFKSGNREFFIAARMALDPTISFGIKKVPLIGGEYESGDLSFDDFMILSKRLMTRELTGNAAKTVLHEAAQRSDTKIWNDFYRQILLKDFKIGVDHKSINKVLTDIGGIALDYLVPVFSCQLAENSENHPKKMKGKKFLDIKFDGARLLSVLDIEAKEVRQYTRNGNEVTNFPLVVEQLSKLLSKLPLSIVLDGEITGSTFQELMTQFSRHDAQTDHNKLMLFDMVPLKDFRLGKSNISQRKRHDSLVELKTSGLFQELGITIVDILPKIEVDLDTPEGQEQFKNFKAEIFELAKTNPVIEGIMIKDADAPYECKKGRHWLKLKSSISVSLTVKNLVRGEAEGKYCDTLGAFECEGFDEGKQIETNVATGLSDDDRDYYWNNPHEILGHIIEVEADCFTQNDENRNSNIYSLRFPRYKGKRGVVAGEKI